MKYLLAALCALSLAACDDGGSEGPAEPCTIGGCPDGELCKNLGFNEELQAAQYECVVPRAMGAECEEGYQCEVDCFRLSRDPANLEKICSEGCTRVGDCPSGLTCNTDRRICLPE